MKYDLEERTLNFSIKLLKLSKAIKISLINRNIIEQVLRSGTSIGANYSEATGASSRKDFRNKIYLCKKEAQETRYWLKLLEDIEAENLLEINNLVQESHELTLIFNKIANSSN